MPKTQTRASRASSKKIQSSKSKTTARNPSNARKAAAKGRAKAETPTVAEPPRGPLRAYAYRSRILQAAMGVFQERGLKSTTVEDILRASNVSRRTFYRFFDNKEAVLHSIYDTATQLLVEQITRALRNNQGFEPRIVACVDAFLLFTQSAGTLLHVMGAEARRPDSPLHPRRRAILEQMIDVFNEQVQDEAGYRVDPLLLHGMLLALEGVALEVNREDRRATKAELARARAAMMRLAQATLARPGDPVPELPRAR